MVSGSAASGSRPRLWHQASVLAPGRAVGAPRAVTAGAGGVDRGAAGQLLELGGVGGAVGHGERAEQGGLQGQAILPGWDPEGGGAGAGGLGGWRRSGRGGRGGLAPAACHPVAWSLARAGG